DPYGAKELLCVKGCPCGAREVFKSFVNDNLRNEESFTLDPDAKKSLFHSNLCDANHTIVHNHFATYDHSVVYEHSVIYEHSVVHKNSVVHEHSVVHDYSIVHNNSFFQEAKNGAEYENDTKVELLHPVAVEMSFNKWEEIDEWLKFHRLEQGFAFTITHSDKDKSNNLPRRCIYACTRGQTYTPRKEAHINESYNTEHNTCGCKFRINTYSQKQNNQIHITKVKN
ncbi:45892_t:CDS:2, partial [Gigaspora margarita]